MNNEFMDDLIYSSKEKNQILNEIKEKSLPKNVLSLIEEYEKNIGKRDRFLWKWGLDLVGTVEKGFMLSSVDSQKRNEVRDLKVIFTIFVTSIDDLADIEGDIGTIKELEKITNTQKHNKEVIKNEYEDDFEFIKKVWSNFFSELKEAPRFDEFKEIFFFDLKKLFDSFLYSCLVNKNPYMLNLPESWSYDAHNMLFLLYGDIDLMFSPSFNIKELGVLRKTLWKSQEMARIGNWVSTWKREIRENNMNSGVIAKALDEEVIQYSDLKNKKSEEIIGKIKDSEVIDYFLSNWNDRYNEITEYEEVLDTVDIKSYIQGVKETMKHHLLSEGLK